MFRKLSIAFLLVLCLGMMAGSAFAATITMIVTDDAGAASFALGTNWPGGLAPTAGNAYIVGTGNIALRTADVADQILVFAGDSLKLVRGGTTQNPPCALGLMNTGSGITTVTNLILNGGRICNFHSLVAGSIVTLTGGISVMSESQIDVTGGTTTADTRTVFLKSLITGGGALNICNSATNTALGIVKVDNTGNTYSGNWKIGWNYAANAARGYMTLVTANANVLGMSAGKGVSTVTLWNNNTLDMSALGNNQAVKALSSTTTACAVKLGANTLTIDAVGVIQLFGGVISGVGGSLTMNGIDGFQELSGANTYTGDTTVKNGILSVTNTYFADGADVKLAADTTLDLNTGGATDTIRSLYIDGVLQATGVWGPDGSGAPNTSLLITGNGFLNVTNLYTLTYTAGSGGSIFGSTPQLVLYGANGDEVTAVPDIGYHFVSWSDEVSTASRTDLNVTANVSVTANFAINYYTVTFDSNGGSTVESQSVAYNNTATEPTAPTKSGNTFGGWYSDAELTTPFSFGAPITADITLYAKWLPDLTVSYDSNGGSAVASEIVAYGNLATQPADPTKSGNTFDGWYSDAELTTLFDFGAAITADITLYAKWTVSGPTYGVNNMAALTDDKLIGKRVKVWGKIIGTPGNPYEINDGYTKDNVTINGATTQLEGDMAVVTGTVQSDHSITP